MGNKLFDCVIGNPPYNDDVVETIRVTENQYTIILLKERMRPQIKLN